MVRSDGSFDSGSAAGAAGAGLNYPVSMPESRSSRKRMSGAVNKGKVSRSMMKVI